MSRDDLISMVRAAGGWEIDPRDYGPVSIAVGLTHEALERFAAMVAAKEREACAQIADIHALGWQKSPGANPEAGFIASSNCATAIRARSAQ